VNQIVVNIYTIHTIDTIFSKFFTPQKFFFFERQSAKIYTTFYLKFDYICNGSWARSVEEAGEIRSRTADLADGQQEEKGMKRLTRFVVLAAIFSVFAAASNIDVSAQTRRKPVIRKKAVVKRAIVPKLYTVGAGKRIRVRMNETISSKTARVGDRFTATVTESVYSTNGVVVIPEGSEVIGRVSAVTPARKGGKVGTIDANFVQVVLPNGTKRAINGSLTDLNSDDAKSDSEGTASGDKMKYRKVIFIGGGGVGGAVLGGAVGGGKGALIGGLIGAGAGLLGDRLTKGEDAKVESGTEFGVYLNRAISLPKFAEVNP